MSKVTTVMTEGMACSLHEDFCFLLGKVLISWTQFTGNDLHSVFNII